MSGSAFTVCPVAENRSAGRRTAEEPLFLVAEPCQGRMMFGSSCLSMGFVALRSEAGARRRRRLSAIDKAEHLLRPRHLKASVPRYELLDRQ